MSAEKENKKSLGSSIASDVKNKEITEETMPPSVSNPKEEEKEK